MEFAFLEKIGFTKGEIKVYMSLISLGSASTGAIIGKSGVSNSKVYLILDKLEQKGLVSHVIKNNVKHFQAADPQRILDLMREQREDMEKDLSSVESLLPALKSKMHAFEDLDEAMIYRGFKGFKAAMYEFISDVPNRGDYIVFGAQAPLEREVRKFISKFYREKEGKKIRTRLIYNSKFRADAETLYKNLHFTSLRFIGHLLPSTVAVSKSKVLIVAYGENPIQVLIKNRQVAASFSAFFESMWAVSKN